VRHKKMFINNGNKLLVIRILTRFIILLSSERNILIGVIFFCTTAIFTEALAVSSVKLLVKLGHSTTEC
jgi:hypothetical protein